MSDPRIPLITGVPDKVAVVVPSNALSSAVRPEMVNDLRFIVYTKFAVPVPSALVAEIFTVYGDAAALVGMPVISPVAVFMLKPGGNPVALKLVGLLLAVMVYTGAADP